MIRIKNTPTLHAEKAFKIIKKKKKKEQKKIKLQLKIFNSQKELNSSSNQ